jgi:hypothetical protein
MYCRNKWRHLECMEEIRLPKAIISTLLEEGETWANQEKDGLHISL